MEVRDNKNEQPLKHYRALLAEMDPAAVSGRTGIPFGDGCFRTRLLDRDVLVTHPAGEARWADSGAPLRPNAAILLLRLLTGGTLAPPTGKLLSYAELPWGETYLTQFRGRCISRLAFSFGNSPEKFDQACRSIGGMAAETGSGFSYDIPFLPERKNIFADKFRLIFPNFDEMGLNRKTGIRTPVFTRNNSTVEISDAVLLTPLGFKISGWNNPHNKHLRRLLKILYLHRCCMSTAETFHIYCVSCGFLIK